MTNASRRPSGELEAAVLAALWAADRPLTAPEVQRRLPHGPARTTVATILARLLEKGTVRRVRDGRVFRYTAAVEDHAALTARRMHAVLDRDEDRGGVLARFVSHLAPEDERMLRALLAASDNPPGASPDGPDSPPGKVTDGRYTPSGQAPDGRNGEGG